jgi:hypothetical protein
MRTCPYCGKTLIEVDNPMRPEFRHRRGEEDFCPGPAQSPVEPAPTPTPTAITEPGTAADLAGVAAGLDVWEQVGKGYSEWYLKDDTLGNAQLWSLRQAIRAELLEELGGSPDER